MEGKKNLKKRVMAGGVLAATVGANAYAGNVDVYFQAGFDFGGDEMVEVFFEDGDSEDIKAGELLYISGGLIIQTAPRLNENLETQLTIGWKFDSVDGENGELSFDRFPLEVLQFVRSGQLRFGGGLTYHLNPKLEGDGFFSDVDVEFDDALGGVVQVDFAATENVLFGGRFTFIDYELEAFDAESIDGNSVGFFVGGRF